MIGLIVAGGRDFGDWEVLDDVLNEFVYEAWDTPVVIITGGARGADAMAATWAQQQAIPSEVYPAEWDLDGRGAGYLRNKRMAHHATKPGRRGVLIAFWDGKSKGTKHMIDIARDADMEVLVFDYRGEMR